MKRSNIFLFTKLYSIAIILLPFLYQYASPLPFLSLGDFLIALFTIYGLIKIDLYKAGRYLKPILTFSSAFIILTIFVSLFSGNYFKYWDAYTIFLKILLYLGVCLVCTKFFDLRFVKRIYIILVRIFAIYLLIQVIYHKVTSKFLPIYLNHDWLFSWEKRPESLYIYYNVTYLYFRPSSLFLEPGYYALYVLPALFLLLFEDKKIVEPLLLYCTILLSTSAAGILVGFFALLLKGIVYVTHYKNGKIFFTRYTIVAVFVLLTLLIAGLLYLITAYGDVLSKLFNSFNSRISRSVLIFNEMDLFHKFFGVGMNNIGNYVNEYKIYTFYDEGNLNFGASFFATLVQYGIIGWIIFCGSLITLAVYSRQSKLALLFILLYILYTAFEEVIFNFRMGFLLSFFIYYIRFYRQPIYVHSNRNICISKVQMGRE